MKLEDTQAAQALLQRCEVLIEKLGVFSANEEVEDIATGDLKYLLVPGYLGDLQSETDEDQPEARRLSLTSALQSYSR